MTKLVLRELRLVRESLRQSPLLLLGGGRMMRGTCIQAALFLTQLLIWLLTCLLRQISFRRSSFLWRYSSACQQMQSQRNYFLFNQSRAQNFSNLLAVCYRPSPSYSFQTYNFPPFYLRRQWCGRYRRFVDGFIVFLSDGFFSVSGLICLISSLKSTLLMGMGRGCCSIFLFSSESLRGCAQKSLRQVFSPWATFSRQRCSLCACRANFLAVKLMIYSQYYRASTCSRRNIYARQDFTRATSRPARPYQKTEALTLAADASRISTIREERRSISLRE